MRAASPHLSGAALRHIAAAATAMLAVVALVASVDGAGPAAADPSSSCPAALVVAVPGTWETNQHADPNTPVGTLKEITDPIQHAIGDAGKILYTPYIADAFRKVPYGTSKASGIQMLTRQLAQYASCSSTRIALLGYSQGADIAGDVASNIGNNKGPVKASQVAAVGLLSDPRRGTQGEITIGPQPKGNGIAGPRQQGMGQLAGRVASICRPSGGGRTADLYCGTDAKHDGLLSSLGHILSGGDTSGSAVSSAMGGGSSSGGSESYSGGSSSTSSDTSSGSDSTSGSDSNDSSSSGSDSDSDTGTGHSSTGTSSGSDESGSSGSTDSSGSSSQSGGSSASTDSLGGSSSSSSGGGNSVNSLASSLTSNLTPDTIGNIGNTAQALTRAAGGSNGTIDVGQLGQAASSLSKTLTPLMNVAQSAASDPGLTRALGGAPAGSPEKAASTVLSAANKSNLSDAASTANQLAQSADQMGGSTLSTSNPQAQQLSSTAQGLNNQISPLSSTPTDALSTASDVLSTIQPQVVVDQVLNVATGLGGLAGNMPAIIADLQALPARITAGDIDGAHKIAGRLNNEFQPVVKMAANIDLKTASKVVAMIPDPQGYTQIASMVLSILGNVDVIRLANDVGQAQEVAWAALKNPAALAGLVPIGLDLASVATGMIDGTAQKTDPNLLGKSNEVSGQTSQMVNAAQTQNLGQLAGTLTGLSGSSGAQDLAHLASEGLDAASFFGTGAHTAYASMPVDQYGRTAIQWLADWIAKQLGVTTTSAATPPAAAGAQQQDGKEHQ